MRQRLMELIEQHASAGGWQNVYRHNSQTLNCGMNFGVYLPPQSSNRKTAGPVLALGSDLYGAEFHHQIGYAALCRQEQHHRRCS